MTVGPMQFGTTNSAGNDTTVLQALPFSTAPGAQRGITLAVLANQPSGSKDAVEAVAGHSFGPYGAGVAGRGPGHNGIGLVGLAHQGSFAVGVYGLSRTGFAGRFLGTVFKTGGGFMIDHPSDPENRYLCHSFVESPDMLNVYAGTVTTDGDGQAAVTLPAYFAELNGAVTYQLTVVGGFARAVVAEELGDNAFTIRTDEPGVKVCWQVTGVRQDAWARANRIVPEPEKPDHERGTYLHPEVHDRPVEQGTGYELEPTFEPEGRG